MSTQSPCFSVTSCGLVWRERSLLAAVPDLPTRATPERMMTAILKRTIALLHATSGALSLYDPQMDRYRLIAVVGDEAASDGCACWSKVFQQMPGRFAWSDGTVLGGGPSMDAGPDDVVVLPDDDPEHPVSVALAADATTTLYVALRYEDELTGAIEVIRPAARPFIAADRRVASSIARHAAVAVSGVQVG